MIRTERPDEQTGESVETDVLDRRHGVLVLPTRAGPIGVALTDEQWADFPLGAELRDDSPDESCS